MKPLFLDTETTGLILYKEPSEDPRQPHIVEIAALLHDDAGQLVETFHAIVRPDGWTIPDDVAEIHGITTERAMDEGIPEAEALSLFLELHTRADIRVAHNESFDARILRIAIKRYGAGETQEDRDALADAFKAAPKYCTCNSAKPIMRLPATEKMVASGKGHWFKPPTMQEAHTHFLGKPFDGAHGASADAKACAAVYFAMNPAAVAA
jgi:DNA polymerase III epsilon subunit-like protein